MGIVREVNLLEDVPHLTKRDVIDLLLPCMKKTLGDVDVNNVFRKTETNPKVTGIAGDVVEQSIFGYKQNNKQVPDLCVDGVEVELKTIGVRKKNNLFLAKEPCSITAVSIDTIVYEEFENSNFWHKANRILFVYYQYLSEKTVKAAFYRDFPLMNFHFYKCSDDDRIILEKDWQIVRDFLRNIKDTYPDKAAQEREYPNLSTVINKRLEYLDTSPKYPNPPRFRFRARFVSVIVQASINNVYEKTEHHYYGMNDVEKACAEYTKKYRGMTVGDLCRHFDLQIPQGTNKQIIEKIIARMFGGTKKISKIEQFAKFGLHGQTVVITQKGGRTEDMKLSSCPLVFADFEDDDIKFEDTEVYTFFNDFRLLCPVFKEHPRRVIDAATGRQTKEVFYKDNTFEGFKILELSSNDVMRELKNTWEKAKALVVNKQLGTFPIRTMSGSLRYTPKTHIVMMETNLPKSGDHIVFFRGTGQDANDKITVNGLSMLRQNYWIKGTYIVDELDKMPYIGD